LKAILKCNFPMSVVIQDERVLSANSLFSKIQYKINFTIPNKTTFLASTDLLRDENKRVLFKIAASKIESIFFELGKEKKPLSVTISRKILFYLIKSTTEDFLESCYGRNIEIGENVLKNFFSATEVLEDVQILLTIPFHILINPKSKFFSSVFLPTYSEDLNTFSEALIDNLIVEVANSVSTLILNEFSVIYDVRKKLYQSSFLSLRNIERFRNNLAWQMRIKKFIKRPANLYNSQQGVWIIRTTGIYYRVIYANRSSDLITLKRYPLITLIFIESKDFLNSRVDEIVYYFGNTLRYTLTSIIGNIIGLVWRGIIETLKK